MNIDKYIPSIHNWYVEQGEYNCKTCDGYGEYKCPGCGDQILTDREREICCVCQGHINITCRTCNGTGQHKNIGELLAEISGLLLGDALRAYGKEKPLRAYSGTNKAEEYEYLYKGNFEDYIAQAFIKLFDFSGYLKIDLKISRKIELKNKSIGSDLYRIVKLLPYENDIDFVIINDTNAFYTNLLKFCIYQKIFIGKNIDARLQYMGVKVEDN